MKSQPKNFVYFGTVLDDELFTDNSVPHLPVGHIIVLSELKKLIAASTTPDLDLGDFGAFYKVASVKMIEKTYFFDRFFKLPSRCFIEVSVMNGSSELKTILIREEVAQSLVIEVSRKAHS